MTHQNNSTNATANARHWMKHSGFLVNGFFGTFRTDIPYASETEPGAIAAELPLVPSLAVFGVELPQYSIKFDLISIAASINVLLNFAESVEVFTG